MPPAPRLAAPGNGCLVRLERVRSGHIEKAVLRMPNGMVYHCVLHESMHAMGIPGHPRADTVLSYFYGRVDQITALDRLMLKAGYGPSMRPGAFPFEAWSCSPMRWCRTMLAQPVMRAPGRRAYAWYARAVAQGYAAAQAAVKRIEPLLTPQQRDEADRSLPSAP